MIVQLYYPRYIGFLLLVTTLPESEAIIDAGIGHYLNFREALSQSTI